MATIQTLLCAVRLCNKPIYDGSFGPTGFEKGMTNLCKDHFFEWITVHDKIYTETFNTRRSLTEMGLIDDDAIRARSREKNPASSDMEIPWFRRQGDTPWNIDED